MAPRKKTKLATLTKSTMVDFDEIEWYTNLDALCRGNRGGGEGEWIWGGPKGGNPTIYCSNLGVAAACVSRRAPLKIRVHGGDTPSAITLLYAKEHVRKPETLIKVGKNREVSPDLQAMADLCHHKAGGPEAEWTVSYLNGMPAAQFYTSILSSAGRLISRNPEVLDRPEILYIHGEPDGFACWVPKEFMRRPERLLRAEREEAVEAEDAEAEEGGKDD